MSADLPLTRRRVMRLAIPVMLAQAAIATTGVVDTIVIGRFGDKLELGAVGIASVAFSFVYWGFGFLRMSTTGLVAQAAGSGREDRARAVLQRALILGVVFGGLILLASPLLRLVMFAPFGATESVDELARAYFNGRIWGAPALLMQYAIMGWLLGTGRTGALLALQVLMNGINVGLDWWFVAGMGWGPAGIGAGTAIAEWGAVLFGLWLVRRHLRTDGAFLDRESLKELFSANRDILIRTLALLTCFAWFVRSGTLLGTTTLAGNEVLLQFITVAAFVLDGFAFVAEKEIGEAYGARNRARLVRAIRVTSELAILFAATISLAYWFGGAALIEANIADVEARNAALAYLPYCALVPLVGVAAFQLDGVLLGATQGRAMRNAGLFVTISYIALDILLRSAYGNSGVWLAFLAMYVLRAGSLGWYMPSLLRAASKPA